MVLTTSSNISHHVKEGVTMFERWLKSHYVLILQTKSWFPREDVGLCQSSPPSLSWIIRLSDENESSSFKEERSSACQLLATQTHAKHTSTRPDDTNKSMQLLLGDKMNKRQPLFALHPFSALLKQPIRRGCSFEHKVISYYICMNSKLPSTKA